MDTATLTRRIADLTAENRDLRDRIAGIEAALTDELDAWRIAGLTPMETTLLALLLKRDSASRSQIMAVCYGADPDAAPEDKIVDVMVSKIRRKLRPLGVTIENIHGVGYRLSAASKARIRAVPTES